MSKVLDSPEVLSKSDLNGLGTSYKQQNVSRDNYSQSIWEKLQFPSGIAHYWKISFSIFQEIFASSENIFFSGGGLTTRQQFYGALGISWYFLIL